MDAASIQFVLFGLVTAFISNLSRSQVWRSAVLMGASIVFLYLLAHGVLVLLPLAAFLVLGYGGLSLLERGWSRSMAGMIVAVLFVYIWLKKYTFLPEGIFLRFPYFTLGLSYIFFRVLHLLLDAVDKRDKTPIEPGAYLLYMLNFTTFVCGPIQRYDEFAADQFAVEPIALGEGVIGLQLERIVRGFFKVNVLATLFDMVRTDSLVELLQPLPLPQKLFAALRLLIVYPLFLYANFSGYIDIVIALARLMRLRLPENFDRPFSTSSVLDFWGRWHMTLSNWLKRYVYNPLLLALMRRVSSVALQPFLEILCFFVTFFLIGVWHGRTSEFVFFGALTGGGISVNRLWQLGLVRLLGRRGYKDVAKEYFYVALCRGLNFVWFGFTLFWFWANWALIHRIFAALSGPLWLGVVAAAWLSATVVLALWEWARAALLSITIGEQPAVTSRYARVVYATAMGLAAFVMMVLLHRPTPGIVYKAF